MSSTAQPVSRIAIHASLQGRAVSLLVIAALGLGFIWAADHDDQRCVELVLLALLAPFMLARADTADQIASMGRPGRWLLGAFFVLGAFSTLGAFSPRHALYEWSMLLFLLLAAALLAAELARAGAGGLQTVLRSVVAIGILYSLRVALMYAALLANGVQPDMQALFVGFSNARFFNHAQTALLPLAILLYLQSPQGSAWRRAAFALVAVWWAFLFLTQARASILALGTGCMLVLVLRRGHAHSFLKAMALSALAGAVLYALAFVVLPVLVGMPSFDTVSIALQRTAADPASGRFPLWKLAGQLMAAHPWLGIGPQHYAHEESMVKWAAHPHNFILQVGAEWGLPALLCLLAAIGIGMRALSRSASRIAAADLPAQQTLTVLLATGAAVFVDGLFSGVIVMPQSQMAIVLYLACAAGWVRSLDRNAAPRAGMPLRWLIKGLAVATLCGLAYAVTPSIARHAMHAPLTPAEQVLNREIHWPRLWEAGHF
jgi:O-antigen ligase